MAWYLLYELVIHPWGRLDRAVIDNLMVVSGGLLEGMGYALIPEPAFDLNRYIGVQGGSQLWIGDPCNGVSLFAVFVIFLLSYPGPWKHKLWFGAVGLLSIHLINALRIASLCIITTIDYELLNFNHDFTFYVIVYSWVFGLWLAWIKWFGPRSSPEPAP
ncbi:MAG: archaeosortase/exosortase family protein [Flavobacteriales bacterium]|nr:archaeosortase/exosortase family protein [Flavobacteriales bacterium]